MLEDFFSLFDSEELASIVDDKNTHGFGKDYIDEGTHKKIIGEGLNKIPASQVLNAANSVYDNYSQQNTLNLVLESALFGAEQFNANTQQGINEFQQMTQDSVDQYRSQNNMVNAANRTPFQSAFREARIEGQDEFRYLGNQYNTQLRDDK